MYERPNLTLPEELLLLCADPVDGRLRRVANFSRVLGGAVLYELLLAGALAVEGRRITEVRPLPLGYPFADQLLAEIAAIGKKERLLKLDRWVRRASQHVVDPHIAALTSRGLLVSGRRRIFGLIPVTAYYATQPTWAKETTARILGALPPDGYPGGYFTADPRTMYLAALVSPVHLDRRIFHGPDVRAARHRANRLTRTEPIADAVRRVIAADEAASSGG
jgi:hypothetical protein